MNNAIICIGNHAVSSSIWDYFTQVSFSKISNCTSHFGDSLQPRVFRLFRQQLVAWRDSRIMEFLGIFFEFFDWLLFCKQPIKKFKEYSKKFHYPRVSTSNQPLTKSQRNSGFEIASASAI